MAEIRVKLTDEELEKLKKFQDRLGITFKTQAIRILISLSDTVNIK